VQSPAAEIGPAEAAVTDEKREQAAALQSAGQPAAATPPAVAQVRFGGPRTAPPTAAEHQAYQEWLARTFGIFYRNPLPANALQQQAASAPAAANRAGGACEQRLTECAR
jgi:hypothetical protein